MIEGIRRRLRSWWTRRTIAEADPKLVQGLLDLAAGLAVEPDLDRVLDFVCVQTRDLVRSDRCSLFVLESGVYRARYNAGNPPDIALAFPAFRVSPSDALVRRAFETGRAVLVNDAARSPLMNQRIAKAARINAIILVPICSSSGAPLAFMTVEFNERQLNFWQIEAVFLDGIANIVAMSIQQRTTSMQLARSRELLRRNERLSSLGTFAAGIVHQVNNPIGSILLAADLAKTRKGQPDELETSRESLDLIAGLATRSGEILRSVLRFARDEVNEKWSYDVVSILTRVVQSERRYAARHDATIDWEADADADGGIHSMANPIEIEQALVNLVRNAIESRESGAQVRVRVRVADDRVVIEVEDDGIGISAEDRAHVFDPFFTRRSEHGGSGLGLSVAHGIILDHGGLIEMIESAGGGTLARVSLPHVAPPSAAIR